MRKDTKKVRRILAFSIFVSLICMDMPLILLLDFLDFGTNFTINMVYLGSSFFFMLIGFYYLIIKQSQKSRYYFGFMVYFGFDLMIMVLNNYL